MPDGRLQLNMAGPAGAFVRLEGTTNLGPSALWVPLLTNACGSNDIILILTDPTNYPQRFYRAVILP